MQVVREYKKDQKWVTGVINPMNDPLSYQVNVASNTIWKDHVDQLSDFHMSTQLEFPSTNFTPPDVLAAPTDAEMTPKFQQSGKKAEAPRNSYTFGLPFGSNTRTSG